MAAADHAEGFGRVESCGAGDQGCRLLAGVDNVTVLLVRVNGLRMISVFLFSGENLRVDFVGERVVAHAENAVLGLNPDLLSGRQERGSHGGDA